MIWRAGPYLGWLLFGVAGCSVNLTKESAGDIARNQCTSDSDCGGGACSRSGACVAHEGALSTLLLEITPPASALGVGGVPALQIITGLERSTEDTKIDLDPTTVVHGLVLPPAACNAQLVGPSGERTVGLPVKVTLTPREAGYGLPTVSYSAQTTLAKPFIAGDPCVTTKQVTLGTPGYEFVVAVPGGTQSPVTCSGGTPNQACYDVYVEPLEPTPGDGGVSGGCTFVPQVFQNRAVASCLNLPLSAPAALDVTIPWPASAAGSRSLDGWTLDVVHPITGQVLSNAVRLRPRAPGAAKYEVSDLQYAPLPVATTPTSSAADDSGKEVIRLSPPPDVIGPVVQAELSGLSAAFGGTTAGKGGAVTTAVFPSLGPFPAPVVLESWVYRREDSRTPVAGNVSLTSTKLDGINPGIFASYSTTVTVGKDGKIQVPVLPGSYRARVVPAPGQGLAAADSTIDVACDHDPLVPSGCVAADPSQLSDGGLARRAGQVLLVPRAAQIKGNVVNAIGGAAIQTASVEATAAALGARQCAAGTDAAACAASPLGILNLSLAEDAFEPRSAATQTIGGQFFLNDVDCGGCKAGTGARFDLSVRPPNGSGFAWLLHPSVVVEGNLDVGRLTVPLPIIHHGIVAIPQKDQEPLPVPNALISAYVMRDEQGSVIDSPAGLPSCSSGSAATTGSATSRCIRSVLQVAETRAANDGTFELVIPSALE